MKAHNGPQPGLRAEIVIYGAASAGEAVLAACAAKGLKVRCFCDDSLKLRGRFIGGLEVRSLKEATASGAPPVFIVTVSSVEKVGATLETAGFSWHGAGWVLDGFDLETCNFSQGGLRGLIETRGCLARQQKVLTGGHIYLKSLDVVISEKCSLRCRDCSNLMQYYKKPVNYSPESIFEGVENILKIVDGIYELRVLGGEPFMHPELHRILAGLAALPLEKVIVYSNGTIPPRPEQLADFANEKIAFLFTDYPGLSLNLKKIAAAFDERAIQYFSQKVEGWTYCCSLTRQNRDLDRSRSVVASCCASHLTTLLQGRLYRCPFIAQAMNLKAIPREEADRLSLETLTGLDRNVARQQVREFLTRPVPASCDYCAGRSFDAPLIEPAIQVSKPLDFDEI